MMLPSDAIDHDARRQQVDVSTTSESAFRPGGVLLFGYLKKLKRMKKKYFILFSESDVLPARLEYYDSEKKWRNGQTPKRSIAVKTCFNINRRTDCKHKFVVALYTNEDCFPIAFDSEDELLKWFITLLKIQLADKIADGEELKPNYEHVWQVTIRSKELGGRKNMVGPHRLCLTSRVLTLFRMPLTNPPEKWELPVMTIRRCGHSSCNFFMEMGRATVTGAGELWMELEEASIAEHMHGAIIEAMRNSAKEDHGPRTRTRSSSVNEQNRPPPQSISSQLTSAVAIQQAGLNIGHHHQQPPPATVTLRNRADSVPCRSRTASESLIITPPDGRPSSIYLPDGSQLASPCGNNSIIDPGESVASSYSIDDFTVETPQPVAGGSVGSYVGNRSRFSRTATPENSLPKECAIMEEERSVVDGPYLSMKGYGGIPAVQMDTSNSDYLPMGPTIPRTALSSSPSAHSISSINHGRVLPSQGVGSRSGSGGAKSRLASVSSGGVPSSGPPPIKPPLLPQNPYMEMSSPVASSPSSSSLVWSPTPPALPPPHPTAGVINIPSSSDLNYIPMYPPGSAPGSVGTYSGTHTRSSSFCEDTTDGSYVPMAPQSVASNSSTTSRDDDTITPAVGFGIGTGGGGTVPSSSYIEMQYRRSVPRDMHQQHFRGRQSPASGSSLASSFTSGTPPVGSHRFQEYHLDKVAALLTPSEDDDSLSSLRCRGPRAFSVGSSSRPESLRRKLVAIDLTATSTAAVNASSNITALGAAAAAAAAANHNNINNNNATSCNQDNSRVRAYSVGSRLVPANTSNKLSSNDGSSSSVNSSRHDLLKDTSTLSPTQHQSHQDSDGPQRKKSLSVPVLSPASSAAVPTSNPTGIFLRTLMTQQQQQQQQSTTKRNIDLMELHFSSDSLAGVDQTDGAASSSYTTQFGSTDSFGRASVASTTSSAGGMGSGRPRSATGQSRPSVIGPVGQKNKLDSFRRDRKGRSELDRLESVPQGRDQDYIEYGGKQQIESPDVNGPKPQSLSSLSRISGGEQDDEYVELANPITGSRRNSNARSSRSSVPRVSVTETEHSADSSSISSPLTGDYMTMDYKNSAVANSLNSVLYQLAREGTARQQQSVGSSAGYMDMNFNKSPTLVHQLQALSQSTSVSDNESYLPLNEFTPKSSRNPSRQSSQLDLAAMLGSFSPSMRGGSQTPRSESARHSRTEESLQEHENYMEMTFGHSESSHSLRSERGTVRTRGPSPNPYSAEALSGVFPGVLPSSLETATGSTAVTPTVSRSGSKASAFLSNLLGRKSSSAGKTPITPSTTWSTECGTLPRSSRSQPPSPFSSLKRPKSSKKRRSATAAPPIAQSLSPVSPDVDGVPAALFYHSRNTPNLRSSSARSPMTPPSPTSDFLRLQSAQQLSPPSACKPGSSQPISITFPQRTSLSSSSYTPRGSPVTHLNLNLCDDYVLAQTSSRFSSSPSRFINMPTLSPLPEVLCHQQTGNPSNKSNVQKERIAGNSSSRPSTDMAADSGYMNMDFASNTSGSKFSFPEVSSPVKSQVTTTTASPVVKLPTTVPSTTESNQPVRIPLKATDAKENSVVKPLPVDPTTSIMAPITSVPVPVPVAFASSASGVPAAPKQRANSLEKIVCAINEKIKIGPKRHSSGDKPLKRPNASGTLIFRSNSYQPSSSSSSRVVVAGNCKPGSNKSLFPLLTDIPAGKVVHASSTSSDTQSSSTAGLTSASNKNSQTSPAQLNCLTAGTYNRTSSSSLASLGEDVLLAGEMQAVNWSSADGNATSASVFRPLNTNSLSPASVSNSSSPSPSLTIISRPTSVQSEREIQYAQLDLTPATKTRRASGEPSLMNEPSLEPPRSPRQFARTVACETLPSGCSNMAAASCPTTYAQIDFKKSEVKSAATATVKPSV